MNRPAKAPAERKKSNIWEITAGREKGRWRWEIEYTRADGTTHRKAGSRRDKADALKARDAAITEYNKSEGRNSQGHTVKSWCEHCLDEIFPNDLRGTTIDAYRHWLRTRVYPLLGNMRLEALTTPTLQVFLNRLQDDDVESSANRTKTALAACLTRAVENG
ncbi:MAG: tyrosine-type recombinase/integrase [Fimbriimonadaceae bacterium]